MQVLIKIALSVAIILAATAIGKKLPATAGLVGVMPLTGALVLVWIRKRVRRFSGECLFPADLCTEVIYVEHPGG